jgi:hypothetical protein
MLPSSGWKISVLETTLAVTNNWSTLRRNTNYMERISELGTTLAVTSSWGTRVLCGAECLSWYFCFVPSTLILFTLMMEAVETSNVTTLWNLDLFPSSDRGEGGYLFCLSFAETQQNRWLPHLISRRNEVEVLERCVFYVFRTPYNGQISQTQSFCGMLLSCSKFFNAFSEQKKE